MKKQTFVIVRRSGTYVLPMESIVYLENHRKKVIVHTRNGQKEFEGKLSDVVRRLDDRFVQCHRSYAVNAEQIRSMEGNTILFKDRSELYLGRDTYRRAKRGVAAYFARKGRANVKKSLR